jgi:2-polyprenyl-3-methyl-5-hydroxy-6-metoxy-1,4-benzoquinol methylase
MKEFWNSRYSEGDAYGEEPNDFLASQVKSLPAGGKILCLAEGEGRNALFLAQNGFQVSAVDFSEVGMNMAKKKADAQGVFLETHVADLAEFDLGQEKWDGIISIFGHLPPELRKKVHQKIAQALKPQGIFLFEAYTPEQLQYGTGGPKDVSMMLTEEIVDKELNSLKVLLKKKTLRDIHEGKYHQGMSSVLQYIGQKS